MVRRALLVTLAMDAANVVVLSLFTLAVAVGPVADTSFAPGYLVVGLIGLGLAARAVVSLPQLLLEMAPARRAIGRRLLVSDLLVNLAFSALLLLPDHTGTSRWRLKESNDLHS